MRRCTAVVSFVFCVTAPHLARGADPQRAEELFNVGVQDLLAGRYDAACPKIAESYELDPLPGALFTLAECEAKRGKPASALRHYKDYLGLYVKMDPKTRGEQGKRQQIATAQVAALESQIPRITILVAASVPASAAVRLDGQPLPPEALGIEQSLDPGEHLVVLEVPGRPPIERRVRLGERTRTTVTLELPPESGAGAGDATTEGDRGAPMRAGAYVAAGVGAAGLAAGVITGLLMLDKRGVVNDHCKDLACDAEGKQAADDGETLGNVSSVAFGVGIAGIATGAVLWVLAPSRQASSSRSRSIRFDAHVRGRGDVGLSLRGSL